MYPHQHNNLDRQIYIEIMANKNEAGLSVRFKVMGALPDGCTHQGACNYRKMHIF